MRNFRLFLVICLSTILSVFAGTLYAQDKEDVVVYSGYYTREQNDGEMARITGKSHYVKFFEGNRIIRLYVPYPFSGPIKPEDLHKIFQLAHKRSAVSAYIKDDFGILDEKIIAHIDVIHRVNGEIMYDCGVMSPCKIVFGKNSFKVLQKGIAKDHVTLYDYVPE